MCFGGCLGKAAFEKLAALTNQVTAMDTRVESGHEHWDWAKGFQKDWVASLKEAF